MVTLLLARKTLVVCMAYSSQGGSIFPIVVLRVRLLCWNVVQR